MNEQLYRGLVLSAFRTKNLENFYNMIGDANSQNKIYLTFGRSKPWAQNERNPNFAPPFPEDSIEGEIDAWTNYLGFSKIPKEYIEAVIPRRDWGDTDYDSPNSFFIGDIICVNTSSVNQVAPGEGFMVYKCVDVPSDGACSIIDATNKIDCHAAGGVWTADTQSYYPPYGEGDGVDMGDGYIWEYLYTIPLDVVINSVTNEYIVVPFDYEVDADPSKWGYKNVLTWSKETSLIYRTKCVQLRFKSFFDQIYFASKESLTSTGFRQLTVILNPDEKKKDPADELIPATNDSYRPEELEPHSGEIIYIENRQPIIRSFDQTEQIQIIFDF